MIIVDTNVLSELMKPSPDSVVGDWVRSRPADELRTTAISLAEIRYGIERLPSGRRKVQLKELAEETFAAFSQDILPFDAAAAQHYASIVARREHSGLPIDGFDAQIAAICSVHEATLATRNVKDFRDTGIDVTNPWIEGDES